MNKTITIYELLGLVKDGKTPKHIKYKDYDLVWEESLCYYRTNKYGGWEMFYFNLSDLNDTVEIIEDNDKTDEEAKPITKESIEALGYACGEIQKCFTNGWTKALENKSLKDNDNLEKINITEDRSGNKFIKTGNYKYTIRAVDEYFANKINGIIDHINKIEEKLDEK